MILDWITDPHLNHLRDKKALIAFLQKLHGRNSDALLLTGDIAESPNLHDFLGLISGAYQRPVYFVLGNHDYYGAWRHETLQRVREVCAACPPGILNWMPDVGVVLLNDTTAIVGHGGMYDARAGQAGKELLMPDFFLPHGVFDLAAALQKGTRHLFAELETLAQESTTCIIAHAQEAIAKGAKHILILTHVPPYHEASYYRGHPADPRSAPWYINVTLGEALTDLAQRTTDVQFDVFAGHTHNPRIYQPLKNLSVQVGAARHGHAPRFQNQVFLT